MVLITFARENAAHLLALMCLVIGLGDAATLVGLHSGSLSPVVELGTTGFIVLACFTIARLFASVGIWINASWGGVLLVSTALLELIAIAMGISTAPYTMLGLGFRILVALLVAIVFFKAWWQVHKSVHD
jgi:hypothetical protein